ncbi:MAG: alpha-L-fucosidase [Vicinamibacteraceae bacterium]
MAALAARPLAAVQRAPRGVDPARPRPTASQLAWQRDELALFVHFTVNTFTDKEWGDGSESPRIFDPSRLDARQWARAAKRGGFRSLILTAKHHDGFCLWPTRTTDHSVRSSPWRGGSGDLVREFTDACRAEGLGAGLYLSPWDRNARSYGQGLAYDDFYLAQLEELLGQYGPLVEVWFDGANGEGPNGKRQAYDWPRIHAAVRRLQPKAVMFSDSGPDVRWIGNESGEAGTTCWSAVDPARVPRPGFDAPWVQSALMQGDPHGTIWRPGEADVSIRPGWFWHPDQDERVRSADNLMRLYGRSVGRNSKLLLNVPPTRDGLFHDRDVQALEAFDAKRRALFEHDVSAGGKARASGGSSPGAVLDADPDTHWRAAGGATANWLEVELPAPVVFDTVRLEEAIELGQHIANHRVDAWLENRWQTVAWGTTIGNTRLHNCAPTTASRIRVVVEFAYDAPALRRVAAFTS